jgi:hypothetical protein
MLGRLDSGSAGKLAIGLPVVVAFVPVADGIALPVFSAVTD